MRVLVRVVSSLLGVVLAAAGVLLAVEAVWAWVQPASDSLVVPWPAWYSALRSVAWSSAAALVTAIIVVVAGVFLLLIALGAGSRAVHLHDPVAQVSVDASPHSVARLVGHRLRREQGVRTVSVRARAKKVTVRATGTSADTEELSPRLADITAELIARLPVPRRPKVRVVVDNPRERGRRRS